MSSSRSPWLRISHARSAQHASSSFSRIRPLNAVQRRGLATPVNPSSSVDALLGTSMPPPPREGHQPLSNPNDLSDLLRPRDRYGKPGQGQGRGKGGQLASVRGTAIGAERRGRAFPLDQHTFEPPQAPEAVSVDRETPHPVDALEGRNELDERLLAAARKLWEQMHIPTEAKPTTLPTLLQQFEERAYHQLSFSLPYEPTPSDARRVPLTSAQTTPEERAAARDDGVLLIAYVAGLTGPRGNERLSVCSGFGVQGGEELAREDGEKGGLIITCAHTLRASLPASPSNTSSTSAKTAHESSFAIAVTRTGTIYPIKRLVSSLPTNDLVLFQLGEPLRAPVSAGASDAASTDQNAGAEGQVVDSKETISPLRTLPLSPYPAVVGSELCVSSAWGWEDDAGAAIPLFDSVDKASLANASTGASASASASAKEEAKKKQEEKEAVGKDDALSSRWGRARLVEYRDVTGREAKPGTYDELSQMDFKLLSSSPFNSPALLRPAPNFPPPGSSGGPVVDVNTGSVVGIVRGTKMGLLEGRRGDAVPAEKVYEFFALPGLGKKR